MNKDSYLELWEKGYKNTHDYFGMAPSNLISEIPLDVTNSIKKSTLFDIGCGQGRNIPAFLNLGLQVVAIDILPEAIATVNEKFGSTVKTVCSDAIEYLSLCKSSSVGIIFANHFIQHLGSENRLKIFLSEIKRVVSCQGYIALGYFVYPLREHFTEIRGKALIFPKKYIMEKYFGSRDYEIILNDNTIVKDSHGGVEHRHPAERIVVKRVG